MTVQFGDQRALDQLNIHFENETVSVLLGPSGCGKSTILRVISGWFKPTTGQIKIDQRCINLREIQKFRQRIGLVIQSGGLFPHLTNYENIILASKFLKWSSDKIQSRMSHLLQLTQFPQSALKRYPVEISGGQRQRVSLMRALMLDPDLILLDEPLGALDPMVKFELQNELKHLFKQLKKTVIFVTHDLSEAVFLGEKFFLMKDGKLIQQGKFADFLSNPSHSFVKKFMESQPIWSLNQNELQKMASFNSNF